MLKQTDDATVQNINTNEVLRMNFFLRYHIHTGNGTQPVSFSVSVRGPFPVGKVAGA
jgi:hypothetical protein